MSPWCYCIGATGKSPQQKTVCVADATDDTSGQCHPAAEYKLCCIYSSAILKICHGIWKCYVAPHNLRSQTLTQKAIVGSF